MSDDKAKQRHNKNNQKTKTQDIQYNSNNYVINRK